MSTRTSGRRIRREAHAQSRSAAEVIRQAVQADLALCADCSSTALILMSPVMQMYACNKQQTLSSESCLLFSTVARWGQSHCTPNDERRPQPICIRCQLCSIRGGEMGPATSSRG
eukprot:2599629-Pleurochrysis_carterae.AAC.4